MPLVLVTESWDTLQTKCSHIDEKFQDGATEFLAGVAKGPKLSIPDAEQSNVKDSDDDEVVAMTHHGSDDQKKTFTVKTFSPFVSKGKQDLKNEWTML